MFYPGTCKEELIMVLKDAGLAGVWLGVQSGSDCVRKKVFKRHYNNQQVLEQALLFHKYGVSTRYDFILDNPFESFEESMESIELIRQLPEPFSLNLFSLKYFPNTEITKMALDAGYVTKKQLDDQIVCDQHNYFIKIKDDHSPSNFINTLAMYISMLSIMGAVKLNKDNIDTLIEEYKLTGDIGRVKYLLGFFM